MHSTSARLIAVALLGVATLAGCAITGPPDHASPTDPGTDAAADDVTLIVTVEGSDAPWKPPNNHPSPRDLALQLHPLGCRAWSTQPPNYGGAVGGEIHLLVPIVDAEQDKATVEAERGVTSAELMSADQFGVAPTQPRGVPGGLPCRRATW
jgi:hypothetical protein